MTQAAAEGLLGSADNWDAAEARWREGITVRDLLVFDDHEAKSGGYLRNSGVPFGVSLFSRSEADCTTLFERLFDAYEEMKCPESKKATASMALFVVSMHPRATVEAVVNLIETSGTRWIDFEQIFEALPLHEDRFKLCEHLGSHHFQYLEFTRLPHGAGIAAAFVADPSRTGLLPIMREFAQSVEVNVPIPLFRSIHPKDETYKAALTVVAAAQKDLDVSTADWIVLQLCELSSSSGDSSLKDALAAARAHVENSDALAALAIGLIDRLPMKDDRRAAAFDTLDDVLRRRTSDLNSLFST